MSSRTKKSLSKLAQQNIEAASGWKERLVGERKKQKLSQRKLAVLAGLGATSLRFIEKESQTITLETLVNLANALNVELTFLAAGQKTVLQDDANSDMPRNVRLLPICSPTDVPGKPEKDLGYVAVAGSDIPEKAYALIMVSRALTPERTNEPTPPELIVLESAVVVWSPELEPQPGELCVADVGRGHQQLEPRVLQLDTDGSLLLGSFHYAFGTQATSEDRVRGRVLLSQRRA